MKVLLISVDGMRPDAIADLDAFRRIKEKASYTLKARTIFPSVTLPSHMSLFHSVPPERHGTTDNTYTPQVRPVRGITEALERHDLFSAIFYNWAEMRDITKPSSIIYSYMANECIYGEVSDKWVADMTADFIKNHRADFLFMYLGWTDSAGHDKGWMSDEYLRVVASAWDHIERVISELDEDDTVIITADHGGHDRGHGTMMDEDMTIPVICMGPDFEPGRELEDVSIMDIAPTITKIFGVKPEKEWVGKPLF